MGFRELADVSCYHVLCVLCLCLIADYHILFQRLGRLWSRVGFRELADVSCYHVLCVLCLCLIADYHILFQRLGRLWSRVGSKNWPMYHVS